jgi:hypothetical protein
LFYFAVPDNPSFYFFYHGSLVSAGLIFGGKKKDTAIRGNQALAIAGLGSINSKYICT